MMCAFGGMGVANFDFLGGRLKMAAHTMGQSSFEARSTVNPWENLGSALGIKLGDPARILTLGKRHCLLPTSTNQEMEEFAENKAHEYGSLKMIQLLKEIDNLNSEFYQLELESHRLTLDGETADLTHADQLEARLASINKLLNHLSQIQERKDAILSQLQARRPENSITIHAPYQMHAHKVLTSLGESITALPSNLASLQWAHQLQLEKTQLAAKLAEGEESLSQCQTVYQTVQNLQQVHLQHSNSN